ncbi:GspE/PulE family protein [Ectobacillus sp. JY-23]|uniref:competence type IV pilus ATPase ComGA n=1 Tax=Ectobacillus sp. JY-23 TaxID=2933872 RepID=UPI001FF6A012|nr:competence type IV pilus ATPase ComGA [Ectobacillus sp. JY-23]UOY93996.1 GspE/PulE family protein [Ectobacillus sp. JY-23]
MSTIEQFADTVIKEAFELKASDIHVIPRQRDAVIEMRVDRDLMQKHVIAKAFAEKLISHFKFLASMDIGEKRKPQNGALEVNTHYANLHLRLSTLPTLNQESLVIRVHLQTATKPLSHLSLFPNSAKKLLSLLHYSHGLIVFTGPTGSGKTTTMYSLLHTAQHTLNRRVVTLEDPIEKRKDGMLQIQINERAGITYASGLKAILRHDPDIILVGEIRDEETAKVAVRASLTGHLVLTTLHTNDAKGAVLRLLDFHITHAEVEQALLAVAAQRLVEIPCPFCREKCSPLCKKMRKVRRLSVYELLYGKDLEQVLLEARGIKGTYSYPTLQKMMQKGYALGFVEADDLQREN